jgi:3',5'-cyclic AMP phosphodiesterase CpdA
VLYNAVWRQGNVGEIQDYGVSYAQYRSDYDTYWNQGWRLYILQSYVFNGQVLYNAVWRPGNTAELQVYGWTYSDYLNKYNTLWNEGWRLYILQSYVLNNQVLYNAVWRPLGDLPELQVYGWTYSDFRNEYNALWSGGWRLYILDTCVVDGQPQYNAVWRMGTVDRPL